MQTETSKKSTPPTLRNGRTALLTGGMAALLASTCCVGSLVLISSGFPGAWIGNLKVLEPYRPAFIGVALAAHLAAYPNLRAGQGLRSAGNRTQLQVSLCGGVGPDAGRADVPLYRVLVLLKGNNHEEIFRCGCIDCSEHPGLGYLQDHHIICSFNGLSGVHDHSEKSTEQGSWGEPVKCQL